MLPLLNDVEVRVLGCLVEKQITTPEYYPLTLNAVTNACNQKSNRDPVLQLDDVTVQIALDSLREKSLAAVITGAGIRTPKYRHYFKEKLQLSDEQVAVLCELMLRGPQTPGELRSRGERMYPFENLAQVETVLQEFCQQEPPLVIQLPRLSGQKELRYVHLLGGMPDISKWSESAPVSENEKGRWETLEKRVALLEQNLAELSRSFYEWKKQFE
ncbi:MAG: DUF480 domain-containing protein [Calditrichaeota bacterium]|nr:MAG: DUF480 domain-containing protein [Calditrichota bacterium]